MLAGNSKTLSFKLAADRMRGKASSSKLFRLFYAIDLFHYQCSEKSTSQVKLLSGFCVPQLPASTPTVATAVSLHRHLYLPSSR